MQKSETRMIIKTITNNEIEKAKWNKKHTQVHGRAPVHTHAHIYYRQVMVSMLTNSNTMNASQ